MIGLSRPTPSGSPRGPQLCFRAPFANVPASSCSLPSAFRHCLFRTVLSIKTTTTWLVLRARYGSRLKQRHNSVSSLALFGTTKGKVQATVELCNRISPSLAFVPTTGWSPTVGCGMSRSSRPCRSLRRFYFGERSRKLGPNTVARFFRRPSV